jgi:ABC-type oligopeptide transport system substrate-binding subunit
MMKSRTIALSIAIGCAAFLGACSETKETTPSGTETQPGTEQTAPTDTTSPESTTPEGTESPAAPESTTPETSPPASPGTSN